MQVNPNIQYNEEDAGLTLDKPVAESVEKVESADPVASSHDQDEADLITAEKKQKEVTVDKPPRYSFLKNFIQSRKDDRLFAASCMATGVVLVVVVYFMAVFM